MRKKREISKENKRRRSFSFGFSKLARAKNNALRNVRGNFEFLFLRHSGDEDDRIVRWSRHVFVFVPSSLFCKVQKRVYVWNRRKDWKDEESFLAIFFFFKSCQLLSSYIAHIAVDKMNEWVRQLTSRPQYHDDEILVVISSISIKTQICIL